MAPFATLCTDLQLIRRPMRHDTSGWQDQRFNKCVFAAAKEAVAATGHPSPNEGGITWLGDGFPDIWTSLFAVTLWVDEVPVTVHVTAPHDE